ncbi:MAG: YdcF family protein [Thermoanaerobaculia bacterium]
MRRALLKLWRDMGPGGPSSITLAMLTATLGLGLPVLYRLRTVLGHARRDERAPADLILVLGRELRNNRPTPVFQARLEHGARLLQQGWAPRILVSGGVTGDSRVSEAEAGRELLLGQGLPESALLVEAGSRHTLENLFNVRETLRRESWQRLILVSDPLHLARAATVARGLNLDVLLSPAVDCPPISGSLGWAVRAGHEAFLLHWYHVGLMYSRAIRSKRLLGRVT